MNTEPNPLSFSRIMGILGYTEGQLAQINLSLAAQDMESDQYKRVIAQAQKLISLASDMLTTADYYRQFGRPRFTLDNISKGVEVLRPLARTVKAAHDGDNHVIDVEWLNGTRETIYTPYELAMATLQRDSSEAS